MFDLKICLEINPLFCKQATDLIDIVDDPARLALLPVLHIIWILWYGGFWVHTFLLHILNCNVQLPYILDDRAHGSKFFLDETFYKKARQQGHALLPFVGAEIHRAPNVKILGTLIPHVLTLHLLHRLYDALEAKAVVAVVEDVLLVNDIALNEVAFVVVAGAC